MVESKYVLLGLGVAAAGAAAMYLTIEYAKAQQAVPPPSVLTISAVCADTPCIEGSSKITVSGTFYKEGVPQQGATVSVYYKVIRTDEGCPVEVTEHIAGSAVTDANGNYSVTFTAPTIPAGYGNEAIVCLQSKVFM